MNASHHAVEQVDQREKSNQHRTDIESHVQAIAGSARYRSQQIFILFIFLFVFRVLRSGLRVG